jgi:NADH:ubiquinone oxidoreductase subunit 5 (subunit L)/multisubunit Na+/H+ antiporter MnhA subunit
MRVPLVVLAALSGVVGVVGIPGVRATFGNVIFSGPSPQHEPFSVGALLLTALLGTGGAAAAWLIWVRRDQAAGRLAARVAAAVPLSSAGAALEPLRARAWQLLVARPAALPPLLESTVVDPATDAVADAVETAAGGVRRLQTGRLSSYVLTVVATTALLALGMTLAATGHFPGVGASR